MRAAFPIAALLAGCSYESSLGRTPADAMSPDVGSSDGAAATPRRAYVKASNTGEGDGFGWGVALSADGSTLAVSACNESSAAGGIGGDQADDAADGAGAVYVFVRSGSAWRQQAYVKASNTGAEDRFGWSIALSADGSTLAVGAPREDSAAIGVDGDQGDGAVDAGAVYVFVRSGATWSQQAYVKASNTGAGDLFGSSVALSGDGLTLAVGARDEDSSATGIDGAQGQGALDSGAVYVFARSGAVWSQQAYVKASTTELRDNFGGSIALSSDGSILAVGASLEDSAATGIDGAQGQGALDSGAVYVFARSGAVWSQQAYVKASNTEAYDQFGETLALSADGATLAVGTMLEDSGMPGNQADDSAESSGAVYVFVRSGATWAQRAFLKAAPIGAGDRFGRSLALSGDGMLLTVGAPWEDGAATGVNGDAADDSAPDAGAVFVFARGAGTWTQDAYVKATDTRSRDYFGESVALSADGATLAVGAFQEDSAATGFDGDQADGSALDAGAVYLLR